MENRSSVEKYIDIENTLREQNIVEYNTKNECNTLQGFFEHFTDNCSRHLHYSQTENKLHVPYKPIRVLITCKVWYNM